MATTTVTPDLDTISMDDLRKLAEEEAAKASTTTPIVEEAKPEEVKEVVKEVVEQPKTFFSERTIDLGDGAGVQVFKGKGDTREAALEDLSDKLAEAQKNATKKIREQAEALKAKPVEKIYTADEESLYSAELLKAPTVAFKKLFKEVTGVDVEEFKTVTAREKAFQAGQEKKRIADNFVAINPDFADTERNGRLINKWCELHNDFSLEGLNKAYLDLNESGLLDVKGEEAGVEQVEAKSVTGIPPKTEVIPPQRTKKASGLSTQRRTVVPVAAATSEEDMYALPLEELRKRANQQLASR